MKKLIVALIASFFVFEAYSQVSAKLIQYPDVSNDHICFTFGDDLWLVSKDGGDAVKLSSPIGRETNPKFSPDGKTIAFEANYDGSNDIYTIPISGGVPFRVTGHGMSENMMDWSNDGSQIMYSSSAESGKQRWNQFYMVDKKGGLPSKLPVELAAYGDISDDGSQIAFTDKSRVSRTWKRYRGGTAPDIHIMDLNTLECSNITNNNANDEKPMWHNDKIYYMSDRGEALRHNLWSYDLTSKEHKQLTFFTDFDIHFPSKGPNDIVFEAGGEIHLFNLNSEETNVISINAVGDFTAIKPKVKSVGNNISNYYISHDGKRALIEARGDIFTLPKENGFVKNLTRTSGVAERYPQWSPNGKHIAYFSDESGEYELTLMDAETGKTRKVTNLGPGFRYNIYWSPDSKKVVFIDQTMTFHVTDVSNGMTKKIDQDISLFQGGLQNFAVSWSKDSHWVAYTKTQENGNSAAFLYNVSTNTNNQITSGFYDDSQVVFDPEGKYLYITTNRRLSAVYSDFDNTWIYPNATQIGLITLRNDVEHPLAPENDEVEIKEEEKDEDEEGDEKDEKKDKKDKKKKKKDKEEDEDAEEKKEEEKLKIDLDNMERRLIILPIKGGNVGQLSAAKGKVVFMKYPNSGSQGGESTLKFYDFENEEEKSIMSGLYSYELSFDGSSLIVNSGSGMGIIDLAPDQSIENALPTSDMKATVDPRKEWKQIFNDVWRLERDFFYDTNMHGVDWDNVKTKYGPLIDQAMSRYDVNFIIGEVIGELNASHTYRGGGDTKYASYKNVGYLGVDWTMENNLYKIKRIVKGADWDVEVRSPLEQPGIDVSEGDYVFEVNGIPLTDFQDPWMAMAGTSGKTVELLVGSSIDKSKAKKVLVTPIGSETRLRNLEWIENNRKKVDEMSNGRIGYIYVPSTGIDGQNELIRMFYGQWNKEGLIIDERFNNGGQIPDRFVELLNRKPLAYFKVRDGKDWQWPPVGHFGPKAMLINGWSGSGGDAFPDYFRKSGLGPLIGTRTWGGVIGISGAPSLIDGGGVTVPTFRMYDPEGKWFAEGHGVEPDIEVKEDHSSLAQGNDTQIEKAVKEVLDALEKKGDIHPKRPEREIR